MRATAALLVAYYMLISISNAAAAEPMACEQRCADAAAAPGAAERVAAPLLACFAPAGRDHAAMLSHPDCCAGIIAALGAESTLARCACCTPFVRAVVVAAAPTADNARWNVPARELLLKLLQCDVPLATTSACGTASAAPPAVVSAKDDAADTADTAPSPRHHVLGSVLSALPAFLDGRDPLQDSIVGEWPRVNRRFVDPIELLLEVIGLLPEFDPRRFATASAALATNGTSGATNIPGSSRTYNDFITAFQAWLERNIPPYPPPDKGSMPPLEPRYLPDVEYVANLQRGRYPAVVVNRPAELSLAATDPLQNGRVGGVAPTPGALYAGPHGEEAPCALVAAANGGGEGQQKGKGGVHGRRR